MIIRTLIITLLLFPWFNTLCQLSIEANKPAYQISVERTGMYELSFTAARQLLGTNEQRINIDRLKLYGKSAGALNELVSDNDVDRSKQIAYHVDGNNDEFLTSGERLIFYLDGPNKIDVDHEHNALTLTKNPYSDKANYFFQFNDQVKVLLTNESVSQPPSNTGDASLALQHVSIDKINLLSLNTSGQGSGQRWFGDEITNSPPINLSSYLALSPSVSANGQLRVSAAVRSEFRESIRIRDGEQVTELSFRTSNLGDVEAVYASDVNAIIPIQNIMRSQLLFTKSANSTRAWIDQIEFSYRQKNILTETSYFPFNNVLAQKESNNGLTITTVRDAVVWDVSNIHNITKKQVFTDGNSKSITSAMDVDQFFVAFMLSQEFPTPEIIGETLPSKIECADCDMIVVYHPNFFNAASRLANHRSSKDQLKISLVNINDIMLQYAAGQPDPSAIRNFLREVYASNPAFRYLLLFGDASYDPRGLNPLLNKQNFIPCYQTLESLDPLLAFPSDDYYGLLDLGEGALRGDLDIEIGRIIARTTDEADAIVAKIIRYETHQIQDARWLANVAFFADDEDNNLHINDSERIANEVGSQYPKFEQLKVYWDAFEQVSTPGGNRYPEAQNRLNEIVSEGALVMNYIGHGGPRGWSQERVLNIDDLNQWPNQDRLPLIVTATCTFTGFDDPSVNSAGEAVFTNPTGGAIALFTTVRSVFASQNFRLTRAVFRNLFLQEGGKYLALGNIMRRAKNDSSNDNINTRKFFLIGDPSMRLLQADFRPVITAINDQKLSPFTVVDTAGALDLVYISGEIRDPSGNSTTLFDGQTLDVVVKDKARRKKTLANDPQSFVREFEVEGATLFKGKASISNGEFAINFRIPKDIDYSIGLSRISLSASNRNGQFAYGINNQLAVGGTSDDPIEDIIGPNIDLSIKLYESNSHVNVPPNITIKAHLDDQSGINIGNQAIGHEITGWLNGDKRNQMILNQLYQATTDDPTSGFLEIHLQNLNEGNNTFTLQAYDIYNNVNQETISFNVSAKKSGIRELEAFLDTNQNINIQLGHSLKDNIYIAKTYLYAVNGSLISSSTEQVISVNGQINYSMDVNWYQNRSVELNILMVELISTSGQRVSKPIGKKILVLK